MKKSVALALLVAGACLQSSLSAQQGKMPASPMSPSTPFLRDPKIPIDDEYTKKIKEYTTEPFFSSPLVDYLPASKTVPTPKAVLGDVAGAPGILPYSHEVYRYMRMLEAASPRVKVFSIGKTEEDREMIAVAVSGEQLLAKPVAGKMSTLEVICHLADFDPILSDIDFSFKVECPADFDCAYRSSTRTSRPKNCSPDWASSRLIPGSPGRF